MRTRPFGVAGIHCYRQYLGKSPRLLALSVALLPSPIPPPTYYYHYHYCYFPYPRPCHLQPQGPSPPSQALPKKHLSTKDPLSIKSLCGADFNRTPAPLIFGVIILAEPLLLVFCGERKTHDTGAHYYRKKKEGDSSDAPPPSQSSRGATTL